MRTLHDQLSGAGNITILHVNIRSISANFETLEAFIVNLKFKPEFIVCTETWNVPHIGLFKIAGYHSHYNEGKINKADGVVMYTKNTLTVNTVIDKIEGHNILTSTVKCNINKTIKISGLYRCHDWMKPDFMNTMKKLLHKYKGCKNHFIVGDFNMDIQSSEAIIDDFLYNFLENGYVPFFNKITRPNNADPNRGSCIDNIFGKTDLISIRSCKYMTPLADHYPMFLSINIARDSWNEHSKNIFLHTNFGKLLENSRKVQWLKILKIDDIDIATDTLISMIQELVERSTTRKKIKKEQNVPRKNWITPGIIKSCDTKEILYKKWMRDPNNLILKSNYKLFKKKLRQVIIEAKNEYNSKIINTKAKNSKELWKHINKTLNRQNTKKSEVHHLVVDGNRVESKDVIAEEFNNFYSTVGRKLAGKIQTPHEELHLPNFITNTLYLTPASCNEIIKTILAMPEKAGGIDGISVRALKTIVGFLAIPLEYIFNLAILKSKWPKALKKGEIIPVYKSGNKSSVSNYRPITLISNIAKLFEKLVHLRLTKFLDDNDIISKMQFGFRKNVGTSKALAKITEIISENLDNGTSTITAFLDLAKAFDTVNHRILLRKLARYGIRGKALELIDSYLSDRLQRVKLDSIKSNDKSIDTGVPQGSILGPLLFILYINDLFDVLPENTVLSYADDTVVVCTGTSWNEAQQKMNHTLQSVSVWLALNQLTLNVSKTVYIPYGITKKSIPKELVIKINGQPIQRVNTAKYLGVIFDCHLKWQQHVTSIKKKTKYLIFVFKKLSQFMNGPTLMTVYYALFNSYATYGIIAWGGAYKSVLNGLQNIQNRLLKIIYKKNPNMKKPLTLNQAFALHALLEHHLSLKKLYVESNSRTRKKDLPVNKHNKSAFSRFHKNVATKCFNVLPIELKIVDDKKLVLLKKKAKPIIVTVY